MDASELDAIRAKRIAELKGQSAQSDAVGGLPGMPGMPQGGMDPEAEAQKRGQQEEMRRNILFQILSNQARERLSRISIVKPEKGKAVEDMLIRMAQNGQLKSKVEEKQLIELLGDIAMQGGSVGPKISFNRRKSESDDDDW